MGYREYEDLVREFHVPIVVGGFEPVDLLEAILMLVTQLEEGRAEVENQYVRSVTYEGNLPAQKILAEVFEVCDRKWRGIGGIPESGLKLREEYAEFDADRIFGTTGYDGGRARGVHQRGGASGFEETHGLPRVRDALHAGKSIRRTDGFF